MIYSLVLLHVVKRVIMLARSRTWFIHRWFFFASNLSIEEDKIKLFDFLSGLKPFFNSSYKLIQDLIFLFFFFWFAISRKWEEKRIFFKEIDRKKWLRHNDRVGPNIACYMLFYCEREREDLWHSRWRR